MKRSIKPHSVDPGCFLRYGRWAERPDGEGPLHRQVRFRRQPSSMAGRYPYAQERLGSASSASRNPPMPGANTAGPDDGTERGMGTYSGLPGRSSCGHPETPAGSAYYLTTNAVRRSSSYRSACSAAPLQVHDSGVNRYSTSTCRSVNSIDGRSRGRAEIQP
jgi:hypothetical protein